MLEWHPEIELSNLNRSFQLPKLNILAGLMVKKASSISYEKINELNFFIRLIIS